MKKKLLKPALFLSLLALCIFLFLIFIPRTYDVPRMQQRPGTQYWNLATGSRIGYTLIPAKTLKQPYPIIFLQGGPGGFISGKNIDALGQLSENGYDVYLYDQIGSGHSARLDNIKAYTADRHKRDLEEIVKQIHTDKVILIGQSWGAILATLFVADNPGKVEKLILTGPGPIVPYRLELAGIQPPDGLHLKPSPHTNKEANEKANNVRSDATALWAKWFGKKLASDEEADAFQTYLDNELNKSTVSDISKAPKAEGGGGYYVQVMTVESFANTKDPRPKLKNCAVPLLIMKGQFDNQQWGFATEYLALFPNHKLVVVPNAGHSISTQQPLIYINTIRDFLKE